MILYAYESGELYPPSAVDHDPVTKKPDSDSYTAYEVPDTVTLKAVDLCEGYGQILEILLRTGQAKKL